MLTCGGIIFRERAGKIEIFFIKDPYNKWTFPKGKQKEGETLVETAVREIREETGLQGLTCIAPVGKTFLRFRREGNLIHKVVFYFLFQAPSNAQERLMTREEYEVGKEPIFEAQWVPLEDVFTLSSYKNSDHLLAQTFRILGKRKQGLRVS